MPSPQARSGVQHVLDMLRRLRADQVRAEEAWPRSQAEDFGREEVSITCTLAH